MDLCQALNFDLSTTSRDGKTILYGHYISFASVMNRFRQLKEHLFCRCCKEMLQPYNLANYSVHTVTRFECVNGSCQDSRDKKIYLNHCFNSKCNAIIDNRDSKKCPHGLYICEKCGSCCSQEFFQRRLSALRTNNPNYASNSFYITIQSLFNAQKGHLDNGITYCHKDGELMTSKGNGVYGCNCGTEYYRLGIRNLGVLLKPPPNSPNLTQ